MVTYLSRAAWGARPPNGTTPLDPDQVDGIAVHWPGMATPLGQDRIDDALRGWQNDHMDNPDKRWSDIAYQVAVDQWGRAWTLRGLTTRSAANGDQDVNQRYGALLLVLAVGEAPTAAMLATARDVIRDFRGHYPAGDAIVPHSQVRPAGTDCPGDLVRAAITRGALTPTTQEDDMANSDEILAEIKALRTEERSRYETETARWKVEAERWQVEAARWQQLYETLAAGA